MLYPPDNLNGEYIAHKHRFKRVNNTMINIYSIGNSKPAHPQYGYIIRKYVTTSPKEKKILLYPVYHGQQGTCIKGVYILLTTGLR